MSPHTNTACSSVASFFLREKELGRKRSDEVLHDLLHKEWRTDFRATTDEHGCLGIRGFHGTHRISVNGRAIGEIKIGPQTPKNLSLPMTEL
jgi:hypothetical protein